MVAISAICHGVAFTGLALVESPPRPPVDSIELIEIAVEPTAPKEPAPTEKLPSVEPVEAPDVAAPNEPTQPVRPVVPAVTTVRKRAARVAPKPATAASEPAPNVTDPAPTVTDPRPTSSSLLSMRRTPAERRAPTRAGDPLNLSPAHVAAAVTGPAPARDTRSPLELPDAPRIPGPRVARVDGPMIPDGNGTFRYDHPGFTAQVARDGRVELKDKPSAQPYFEGPCLNCVKRDLAKYSDDPTKGEFINLMALLPKVGIRFDITDYVMRKIGDDPYNPAKAKFLDETREQREKMWHAESKERLREALQMLPAQLAEIWSHEAWSASERRQVLFDLWDECAETGSPERVRLGRQIRVSIIAFIRKRLPAGSEDEYPEAELQALNKRRTSKAKFLPYSQKAPTTRIDDPN